MEIKNRLTVTRVEGSRGQWGKEGEESRNIYKGHMDKDNGAWIDWKMKEGRVRESNGGENEDNCN